jgi:chemotaxis response regulator CheB
VAVGSSAGGPTALTTLLAALPADFPAAIVIVQHVDRQFTEGLTAWFATHTKLQVRVAQEGDSPQPGIVYLAGRDRHLVLSSPTQLGYVSQPADTSYCPSVDVFFKSLARNWRGRAIGVLLTGMGRDGAEGLKALREAGHYTIAQDKRTSAVYGMPKAAAELDAAREILALDKIAPRLTNILVKHTWPTNAPT